MSLNRAIVIGGALGLGIAFWCGLALSHQASAARAQSELQRRDHATEIFNLAVEQLSDERLEVRLAAIYTLEAVSVDFSDFSLPAIDVLQAFLIARTADRREEVSGPDLKLMMEILADASHRTASGR